MKLISILFSFSIAIAASAQVVDRDHYIRQRTAEKIAQIYDYMSFMANKKKTIEARQYYMKTALSMFIGEGNSYEENGVEKDGVLIHIKSKNGIVKCMTLKNYFHSLVSGFRSCSNLKIESIEVGMCKVSELCQIDTALWVCTCQFDQVFGGFRNGRPIYRDITTKMVKCYITKEFLEDYIEDSIEYIVVYGDVYAVETI